ncbi:latent-transforming growth factor beta-binding protein 1-like [Montipora foliosa]|uniref:latent-transforming growth factor beta-binding protein 1-like n=1 Tax=Montipora foliosa TaxID=591990 RepID=UPI0035F1C92D
MDYFLRCYILYPLLYFGASYASYEEGSCRALTFQPSLSVANGRLQNHVIKSYEVDSMHECEWICYQEYDCVSVNFETEANANGKHKCELNNSTYAEHGKDLINAENYIYRGTENACGKSACENGGTCQSGFTQKRYRCLCPPGFNGDFCQEDVDECSSENECHVNATCTNTIGSYKCTCKEGFTGDGRNCSDINECSSENECHVNATCTNTKGSYKCTCKEGYTGDGRNCSDIDECSSENNCLVNATCTNIIGSYKCTCKKGYGGDGAGCPDINKCSSENECHVNATCANTKGSYNCTCKEGYEGDGRNCSDIDECSSKNNCHVNATCKNIIGSYNCTCKKGYGGDGGNCSDINECSSENECHVNATCTNTKGSYNCTCKEGYGGDGRNCSDIDECSSENNCHVNANCTNTIGSYNCTCKKGYRGDGRNCLAMMNSEILSSDGFYLRHLAMFLSPVIGDDSRWELCYRSSTHGDSDRTFHRKCDGRNNTVTIVKKSDFVFGGFTDIPWESPQNRYQFGATEKAFIFSLRNAEGLPPFKSNVKDPSKAIRNKKNFGPTFGENDILIDRRSGKSSSNFGDNYNVPTGVEEGSTLLAGASEFEVDEVEVFFFL